MLTFPQALLQEAQRIWDREGGHVPSLPGKKPTMHAQTVQANSPSSSSLPSLPSLPPSHPLTSRSVRIFLVGDTQWPGQIRVCGWLPLWLRYISWRKAITGNHLRWFTVQCKVKWDLPQSCCHLLTPYTHTDWIWWLEFLGWEWSGSKGGTSQILSPEIYTPCTGTWPEVPAHGIRWTLLGWSWGLSRVNLQFTFAEIE